MDRVLLLKSNRVRPLERMKVCQYGVEEGGGAGPTEKKRRLRVFGRERFTSCQCTFRASCLWLTGKLLARC